MSVVELTDFVSWNDQKDRDVQIPLKEMNVELNKKVCLFRGDITKLKIDAIVNAANSALCGGGGVDGAIHDAAGYDLYTYMDEHYDRCPTGDFKPSPGFNIPCKEILHGVGPIGEKPDKLSILYTRCMDYCIEKKYTSIAFPCISTGIYGYDNKKACPVVLETIRAWLEEHNEWNGLIIFCCFLYSDVKIYNENLPKYFPYMDKAEAEKIIAENEKKRIEMERIKKEKAEKERIEKEKTKEMKKQEKKPKEVKEKGAEKQMSKKKEEKSNDDKCNVV